MNIKRLISIIVSSLSHFLIGVVLFYGFKPIAVWYLNKIPALGIDLYNSVTAVALLQKYFSFWFSGYKDIWFGGYPLMHDFPRFHYYLMIPFANVFGTVKGIQIYVVVALFLLLFFCYLLFYKLSRNRGFALLLSVLVMLSVNIYGSATWGGSLPYFATQLFLPLVLLFEIYYLTTSSIRWFLASFLFAGLGFLAHPLPTATFIIPSAILLLLFFPGKNKGWSILERFRRVTLFLTGVVFVAFILFYDFFLSFLTGFFRRTQSIPIGDKGASLKSSTVNTDIMLFYKNQIATLFSGTNSIFYVLGALGIVIFLTALILKKEKRELYIVLPFLLIVLYVAGHAIINLLGYSFLSQGLYRTFWAFPIVVGALVAVLWRPLFLLLERKKDKKRYLLHHLPVFFNFIATIGFVIFAYFIFTRQTTQVIERIYQTSDTSSAFPEILSMKLDNKEQEELKKKLVPSFINPRDKNKRLYVSDATVSIWWNGLYDMPQARGYIDPPIGTDRRGGFFLLDIAISNDTLVRDFKFTEEMARNYALYLIDWYGIYYFEGGHVSPSANAPPSSYLLKNHILDEKEEVETYGAILRNETPSGRPEARFDLPQKLVYYKVNEKDTSPIIYGSNAPTILIIADDPGYEQVWRGLASENLNSRFVIPVFGGKFIDDLNEKDFLNFDAIILHNYASHNQNRAFSLLSNFVQKGGKLFIDTGGEVRESEAEALPELLPLIRSERHEIKRDWSLDILDHPLTRGINFSEFGPPIFNQNPWKFSYPKSESDIRKGAKIIMKNYEKPVLIERDYGSGKVIWSGLNLFYHLNQYPSKEEAKFIKNVIQELIVVKKNDVIPVQAIWERPEKIRVNNSNAFPRGILFKEQFYDGWTIKSLNNRIDTLKAYKTGPTYPGFMYVPLSSIKEKPFAIEISYHGVFQDLLISLVSIISVFVILEMIIFNGVFIGRKVKNKTGALYQRTRKIIDSWWAKEEE